MRKLIAKAEAPPKKKKADTPPPPKITHGQVWVSQQFVGWQEAVLRALQVGSRGINLLFFLASGVCLLLIRKLITSIMNCSRLARASALRHLKILVPCSVLPISASAMLPNPGDIYQFSFTCSSDAVTAAMSSHTKYDAMPRATLSCVALPGFNNSAQRGYAC